MADKITRATAKKLEEEQHLKLIGIGGGMMDNVRMMAMSFSFNREITLEEGRELLVVSVEEYLKAVNSNEKIRPYLANYPFDLQNIEIRIFIQNPDRSDLPPGKICAMQAAKGFLDYDSRDPSTNQFTEIHRETFEEALQKLGSKE